jgi:transposase
MTKLSQVFIGVDISKNNLDIFVHPVGLSLKIDNSEKAIIKFIKQLSAYQVMQIACEATGGYEKLLVNLLKEYSYDCWIVDPRRIKGFIVASGCRSKTDKIDAKKIAEFAFKNSPDYEAKSKTHNEKALQALVDRKADLTQYLATEKARLKHPSHALSVPSIKKFMAMLEKEIKKIDSQIAKQIVTDSNLDKKVKLLESIPGIGKATAALLVSHVPELGQLPNSKISALIGVCPYNRESGAYKGKSYIRGGRMVPRNALYMCALSTIKHHLPLKEFYDRLIEKKKPFKVAIVAVMRKLIIIANAILKKAEPCRA